MKLPMHSLLVVAAVAVAAPASAQFAKPEDAVKYRQSAMALIGNHMGRINAQLKSGSPNVQAIQSSAALIETLSKLPFEAFTPGSDMVANTKVKPEYFKDTAKVKELTEKMQGEVSKLAAVSKTGDVKSIQAQFGTVGQSCKACHDDYRMK
ncbi:MAG: c-type cytochrome [Burkholderiaceae bacterium]